MTDQRDSLHRARRWVCRTPRRFAFTVLAATVVCILAFRAVFALAAHPAHAAAADHPAHTSSAAATPTVKPAQTARPRSTPATPPSPTPTPTPTAKAAPAAGSWQPPAAAVEAAANFAAAWVTRGPGWGQRIRQYATSTLTGQLSHTDLAANPATKVTGPPHVTGHAHATVHLSVPTDAGPALVTVIRDHRGRWRAESVMLARTGS
jgi:hypothetical protein